MADKDLVKRLGALGFSLFEAEEAHDANKTLADVAKSRDLRFWEAFPVALANAAEKGSFDYDTVKRNLNKSSDRSLLDTLLAVSLALYGALNLKFSWSSRLYQLLPPAAKKEFTDFLAKFKAGKDLKVAGHTLSSQRFKNTFNNYFARARSRLSDLLSQKEELNLEYSLSQVFSPKQKELFLKKLSGEKLTKTEKEYFSRAVKKKVLALANSDLHDLAVKLLS